MGIQNLFYMSRQMAVRLSEIAEKNQVKKLSDIVLNDQKNRRFAQHPELAWLEQNLVSLWNEKYVHRRTDRKYLLFSGIEPVRRGQPHCS